MPQKIFNQLWKASVGRHDAMPQYKAELIYRAMYQCRVLEGNIAEAGVYKGATANMLARMAPDKLVHLFDTWEGLPDVDERYDLHHKGDFATSYEDVVAFLQDCPNVRFYKGFFPDTAGPVESEKFCFVHLDFDLYQCTLDGCEFFYPRMVKDGIIIFDDFLWHATPGVKQALDEFFADKPEKPVAIGPHGHQAMLVKD